MGFLRLDTFKIELTLAGFSKLPTLAFSGCNIFIFNICIIKVTLPTVYVLLAAEGLVNKL